MIPTIDIPTALGSADLQAIQPYRGALNATSMGVNGTHYGPFALMFLGFAGSLDTADETYHGHYKFRLSQPNDSEQPAYDLTVLPHLPVVLAITEPEEPDSEEVLCPS